MLAIFRSFALSIADKDFSVDFGIVTGKNSFRKLDS